MAKALLESPHIDLPPASITAKILTDEPPKTTAPHLAMKGRWFSVTWGG